ncbi:MAG: hydrogenase nickel incorporation protein HypB [Desulfuromonadaceae bacterium]|nr:hydrogenase nickel incorporation protein HypB [Desulfuromonadaceae bacterium]
MCDDCGCGHDNNITFRKPGAEAIGEHHHGHQHGHEHHHADGSHHHHHHHHHPHGHSHSTEHAHSSHSHSHSREIIVEQDILSKNNLLAQRNRGYFEAKEILALNLVSSPGSGKTSLLERTITDLGKEISFYVIEGDQQTMNDAKRIDAVGAPVIQINTGNGCHLDAEMINRAAKELDVENRSVLMIENVGNLVCPALFDLGEKARVVIMSTTEGEDKPQKYPAMFQSSQLCIINKIDLLPYLDFDIEQAKQYVLQVNPHLKFIEVSVKTGEGLDHWYAWLKNNLTI